MLYGLPTLPSENNHKELSVESRLYLFYAGHTVSYKLGRMILPQLEEGRHGVEVAAMFFFEDNCYLMAKGNPIGQRLSAVAKNTGMLLMCCDQCCYEREIAGNLIDGVPIGCFPDLYKALSGNMPDQVITL
ncbi:MAG: SaoD/DsrE family protein [Bryobacteraceae bacterium]